MGPVSASSLLSDLRRLRASPDTNKSIIPTTKLRLFLDSARRTQIEQWMSTGLFHGITCDPVILQQDGIKCDLASLSLLTQQALELGCREVHLQAWGSSVAQMSSTAFDLAGIDPQRVVVKLPCTLEGIQTAGLLRNSNVRVTITGLFTPPQVLVAQAVGADYASPYLGPMNDAYGGSGGLEQVCEMQRVLQGCQPRMRLMVTSIRDTADLTHLASIGCNTFALTPTLAAKLFTNPFTIDAAGEMEAAAQANGGGADALRNVEVPVAVQHEREAFAASRAAATAAATGAQL